MSISKTEARRIIRLSTAGLDPKPPTEQQQKIISKICEAATAIGDSETAQGIQRLVEVLWGSDMAFQLCDPSVNRTDEATEPDGDTGQGVEMDADDDGFVIEDPPLMGVNTMSLAKPKAADVLPTLLRTVKAHRQGMLSRKSTHNALLATCQGRASAVALSLNRIERREPDPVASASWALS